MPQHVDKVINPILRTVAASALLVTACSPHTRVDAQQASEVVGSWRGGEVLPYERPDSQVIFFSVREDSSLFIPLIYEVGPRARVWSYDIDVDYRDGVISWAYHEGRLDPTGDTMRVSKDYRGERSEWMWVRDTESNSLMEHLRTLEDAPFVSGTPPSEDDGWDCAAPEAVGLDGEKLSRFLQRVSQGEFGDIHGFLLARHGTLVIEEYFAEQGRKHGPFVSSVFRNRVHHLASVTKSVTSALVGIAIDQGHIDSVTDPVIRYLPGYASLLSGEKEAITIEHMLAMTSGLEWRQPVRWSDPRNDAAALWRCPDVVGYVLEKPLVATPGERFVYSNGSAAVVGAILENATGMQLGRYAEQYLFQPLGITEYLWSSYPDGTVEADGGLALRPRDLAKIGQVFLDRGRWHDAPVLSESWVTQSTQRRVTYGSVGGAPVGYGYSWQQLELTIDDRKVPSFFHPGDGGQLLLVVPELEMVVVFTGGTYGADVKRRYFPIISEYILPAVSRQSG
jgi:CubicO group peptidase (beta-lactamase class C family)